jgi:hypothetical protein
VLRHELYPSQHMGLMGVLSLALNPWWRIRDTMISPLEIEQCSTSSSARLALGEARSLKQYSPGPPSLCTAGDICFAIRSEFAGMYG